GATREETLWPLVRRLLSCPSLDAPLASGEMPTMRRGKSTLPLAGLLVCSLLTHAGPTVPPKPQPVPHGQDAMPGPPLSPQEALRKMQVPDGFSVELVASEPDIVNPIGMTFDERGRIWITESLEYPRHAAGPGRDRVKVLEDTGGDGKVDKVTV